jgi:hypothetical protein
MEELTITFWLALLSFACWPVCFWWMHRISKEQGLVLKQLHEQGERIEHLSKEEHDLVKELHPQVEKIQENVEQIVEAAPGQQIKASRQR